MFFLKEGIVGYLRQEVDIHQIVCQSVSSDRMSVIGTASWHVQRQVQSCSLDRDR